jgi:hypothetical protein
MNVGHRSTGALLFVGGQFAEGGILQDEKSLIKVKFLEQLL